MRKFIKWGLIGTGVVFIIGLVTVPSNKSNVKKDEESTTQILNDKEKRILSVLLKDDIQVFIDGGDSMFFKSGENKMGKELPLVITANHLQTEYEKNEVAADQKFKNKNLLVSGKVREIAKDFAGNIVIHLQGGSNPFMTPMVSMEDGYIDYAAHLEKAQNVHLVCNGNGMVVGSAILKECLPADVWADKAVNEILVTIPDGVESKEQSALQFKAIATVMSNTLPNNSECFVQNGTDVGCLKEMVTEFKKENIQKSVTEEGKKIGVIAKNK